MSSIACPFCGEMMESPLRFCVACGRAITADDLKRAGLNLQQGKRTSEVSQTYSDLSKKDFTFHRKARTLMNTMAAILLIFLGYYLTMKYFLHEHMPGNFDVKIEQFVRGEQGTATSDEPASQVRPAPAQ